MARFRSNDRPMAVTLPKLQKSNSRAKLWFFLVHLCVWAIALDQGSKSLIRNRIPEGQLHSVTFFLDWTHIWNKGISFGLFPCQTLYTRIILGIVSLVFIGFLLILCTKSVTCRQRWGSGLMVAGAVSNGLDRIIYQGVFDFIRLHWGTWDFPVFNVADMLITMGFLALLSEHFQWNALRFQKKQY